MHRGSFGLSAVLLGLALACSSSGSAGSGTGTGSACQVLAVCCTSAEPSQQQGCLEIAGAGIAATCSDGLVAFCSTVTSPPGSGSGSDTGPGSGSGVAPGSGSGVAPGSGSGVAPGSGNGVAPGSGSGTTGSGSGTGPSGPCPYASTDSVDHDGDGWSSADGDCNDCNKFINPGAYDVPGDGIDEDCDGKADDEPTGCDAALTSVATTMGSDGATAMDLCRTATAAPTLPMKTWGVISADYVLPDGTATESTNANFQLGFGILGPLFGTSNATQEGKHMLGLSSGTARQPTDPGYSDPDASGSPGFDKGYTSGAPAGFPGQTPACPGVVFGPSHDGAGLRVVMRVPTNALTMSFDSNFFSSEFPDYVCSAYNDTFVVIMTPSPSGEPTTANDNIAFDPHGNIISVNSGFLAVCDPNTMAGNTTVACAEGPGKLAGTGFAAGDAPDMEDHASTDWLTTTVSVASLAGKQVTFLFAIWDSSDGLLDSTVLLDDVHWTFATAADTAPPPATGPVTTMN